MRFVLAQVIAFVLGGLVAIIAMKTYNPDTGAKQQQDYRPFRHTPERIGPPPAHDLKKPPGKQPSP